MADPSSSIKFPEILNDLISSHHLSRGKIAAALDISSPALSHYLNGDALPRLDLLIKIASFFNVSLDYLVLGQTPLSPMSRDMSSIANLVASMALQNQDREESYLRIYSGIAESLGEQIREAAKHTHEEFRAVGAHLILEREVLELETHAKGADILTTTLGGDIHIDDDSNEVRLGAFFHTVVGNLNRRDIDFRYRVVFPKMSNREMNRIVHTYRHLLRQNCVDAAVNRFLIGFTEYPLITGCALYQVSTGDLKSTQPILHQYIQRQIDEEGWVGIATSSARGPQTNVIMDREYVANAREAFEQMWRSRVKQKKPE